MTNAAISENIGTNIQVTVKLFAIFQETFGVAELTMHLESDACVSQVFDHLVSQQPHLEKWRSLTRYAINLNFVDPHTVLQHGDEVALIPPVSGG